MKPSAIACSVLLPRQTLHLHKMSKAFYQWTTVVLAALVILLVLLHDASCAAQDAPLPRPKPVEGKWGFGVPVGRPMARLASHLSRVRCQLGRVPRAGEPCLGAPRTDWYRLHFQPTAAAYSGPASFCGSSGWAARHPCGPLGPISRGAIYRGKSPVQRVYKAEFSRAWDKGRPARVCRRICGEWHRRLGPSPCDYQMSITVPATLLARADKVIE
jgi:hypothetical protein